MAKSRGAGRSRRARYGRFSANWLLCLLGLVLVTGSPLALAQDVLEAPEEVDTSSLIIADIRKPVYVDEEGNFVEADTDKYSETFVPACSQVCAKLPGGATSSSSAVKCGAIAACAPRAGGKRCGKKATWLTRTGVLRVAWAAWRAEQI